MHVQIFPPSRSTDPEEDVEDNLRAAYRTTPPRGLTPDLEELLDRLRDRREHAPPLPPRRFARGSRR